MPWHVEIGYDDSVATVPEQELYRRVVAHYDPVCIGHDRTGTSTLIMQQLPDLAKLQQELGDIPIRSINGVPLERIVRILRIQLLSTVTRGAEHDATNLETRV